MAEDADKSSKTEEPTPKRLNEARNKGQVAKSQEVNSWFMLLTLTILVIAFIPTLGAKMLDMLRGILMNVHEIDLTGGGIVTRMREVLSSLLAFLLVPMVLAVCAGLAANLLQTGFLFAPESISPKPEKLNPISGVKRLFSLKSVVDFLKGIIKISLVATVALIIIYPDFHSMPAMVTTQLSDSLGVLREEAIKLLIGVMFVLTIIAFLDLLYQRYEHTKNLRMTKQEVKDENKQSEGDPQVKAKIRSLRMQRARQRMMAAVPTADVVVTNPTHFAVALQYDQESMAAPKLVAKGADLVAKRIRDVANDNDVPIVENAPLARALYSGVELDQEVPEEHYQAVAEVISYVMRLRNQNGLKTGQSPRYQG